jgi:hypothetical protein
MATASADASELRAVWTTVSERTGARAVRGAQPVPRAVVLTRWKLTRVPLPPWSAVATRINALAVPGAVRGGRAEWSVTSCSAPTTRANTLEIFAALSSAAAVFWTRASPTICSTKAIIAQAFCPPIFLATDAMAKAIMWTCGLRTRLPAPCWPTEANRSHVGRAGQLPWSAKARRVPARSTTMAAIEPIARPLQLFWRGGGALMHRPQSKERARLDAGDEDEQEARQADPHLQWCGEPGHLYCFFSPRKTLGLNL